MRQMQPVGECHRLENATMQSVFDNADSQNIQSLVPGSAKGTDRKIYVSNRAFLVNFA